MSDTLLPCPHGRPDWRTCPHCLGVNDYTEPLPPTILTPAHTNSESVGVYGEPADPCSLCDGLKVVAALVQDEIDGPQRREMRPCPACAEDPRKATCDD